MKKPAWKWIGMIAILLMMTTTVGAASGASENTGTATSGNTEYVPVEKNSSQKAVFIHSIQMKDGKVYLNVDPIEWYEGEEANVIFREREQDPEMTEPPNGYYIVNDTEEQEMIPVSGDAEVLLQLYDQTGRVEDMEIIWNQEVSLNKFIDVFHKNDVLDIASFPYHITVEDGQIVKIIQQYVP